MMLAPTLSVFALFVFFMFQHLCQFIHLVALLFGEIGFPALWEGRNHVDNAAMSNAKVNHSNSTALAFSGSSPTRLANSPCLGDDRMRLRVARNSEFHFQD